MPFRISIASLKGGVGKSTTAMMIADSLSYFHGAQVLVVDLDPQANCSQMLLSYSGLKQASALRRSLTHWVDCLARGVNADFFDCITAGVSGLQEVRAGNRARSGAKLPGQTSVVPSTPTLRFAELAFDHRHYNADDRASPRKEMIKRLEKGIKGLGNAYDFVVFDCPPSFSTLAQSALCLSDGIVSPILEDPVSVWSLKAFRDFGLKQELDIWKREKHRVLYTRVQERGANSERISMRQDVNLSGFEVLSTSIKDTVHAMRWSQRTALDNFQSFKEKYGPATSTVEQLGNDVMAFSRKAAGNLRTSE